MTIEPLDSDLDLGRRVYRIVQEYVYRRTEDRSGIKWADFKDNKIKDDVSGRERVAAPDDYRDARSKVCQSAFFAMRACRAQQDFVEYFTGTICSVPQYLPASEYREFAAVLLLENRWEEVKALSMLALSALWSV